MKITDKTVAMAHIVVDAGCVAAYMCAKEGVGEQDTIRMLSESLLDDNLSTEALLELLGVALIHLAKQQVQVEEVEAKLLLILAAAREKGIEADV